MEIKEVNRGLSTNVSLYLFKYLSSYADGFLFIHCYCILCLQVTNNKDNLDLTLRTWKIPNHVFL